jgi:hypothetical protein
VIRPTTLAGGHQNEFTVDIHGLSEKERGRQ